jgi:hypothetical protein
MKKDDLALAGVRENAGSNRGFADRENVGSNQGFTDKQLHAV